MVRGGQIVLLDLGMTGRLNAKTRSVLKDMIFAVAEQDSPSLPTVCCVSPVPRPIRRIIRRYWPTWT